MCNKKIKLFTLILFGLGFARLQAQSTLYVKDKSGTQTSLALSGIRKLSFPTGNLQVIKNDGTTNTYALNNLRYFNFTNLSLGFLPITNQETNDVLLFPNPVFNELHINYQSIEKGILQISIFDIQGRIILQQMYNYQNGANNIMINITQLTQGLYVYRMQNGNNIESIKFIKN